MLLKTPYRCTLDCSLVFRYWIWIRLCYSHDQSHAGQSAKRLLQMSSYFHFTLQEFNFQKAHTIELFHEPVESQAIDSVNSRYAAASHSGTIKVFTIDDYSKSLLAVLGHLGNVSPSDSLMPLWQLDIGNLPINTRFYGTKRNLIVHALYTSEMYDWHIPSHSVNEQHLIDYVLMFRTDRSLEQPLYVGRCKCRSRIYYSFAHLSTT